MVDQNQQATENIINQHGSLDNYYQSDQFKALSTPDQARTKALLQKTTGAVAQVNGTAPVAPPQQEQPQPTEDTGMDANKVFAGWQQRIDPPQPEQPKPQTTQKEYKQPVAPPQFDYQSADDERLKQITENLQQSAQSSPWLFADRGTFDKAFSYWLRSDAQKAVLDDFFNSNQANQLAIKDASKFATMSNYDIALGISYGSISMDDPAITWLKITDPAKYDAVMKLKGEYDSSSTSNKKLNGDNITTSSSLNDPVKAVQTLVETLKASLGQTPVPDLQSMYDTEINTPENRELSDSIASLQWEIDQIQLDIANKKKDVYARFDWQGIDKWLADSIANDEIEWLQRTLTSKSIQMNTKINQYNTRVNMAQQKMSTAIQEYSLQNQEFNNNLNILQFANGVVQKQVDQQNQYKLLTFQKDLEFEVWKKQELYTTWDINSDDPALRQKAVRNAVEELYTQFDGLPFQRTPTQMTKDILDQMSQGWQFGNIMDQIFKDVKAKPQYKAWANKQVGISNKPEEYADQLWQQEENWDWKLIETPTISNLTDAQLFATLRAGKFNGKSFFSGVYATGDPDGSRGAQIYEEIQVKWLDTYMEWAAKRGATVTTDMIKKSADAYGVDPIMLAATMQLDSWLWAKNSNNNPWNVGQTDAKSAAGIQVKYNTLQDWVDAVAKNIKQRIVALGQVTWSSWSGNDTVKDTYLERLKRWALTPSEYGDIQKQAQQQWWLPEYNEALKEWLKTSLTPKQQTQLDKYMDNLRWEPLYKQILEVQNGYQNVKIGVSGDNAVGDLQIVNGFAKMLDPTGVVRPEEFKTVEEAQPFFQKMMNLGNKIYNGDRLTTAMRQEFLKGASNLYGEKIDTYQSQVWSKYEMIADMYGLPKELFDPFFDPSSSWSSSTTQTTSINFASPFIWVGAWSGIWLGSWSWLPTINYLNLMSNWLYN